MGGQRFLILPGFRYEHAASARVLQGDGIKMHPVSSLVPGPITSISTRNSVTSDGFTWTQPMMMIILSPLLMVREFLVVLRSVERRNTPHTAQFLLSSRFLPDREDELALDVPKRGLFVRFASIGKRVAHVYRYANRPGVQQTPDFRELWAV